MEFWFSMDVCEVEIATDCVEVASYIVATKSGTAISIWLLSAFEFKEAVSLCTEDVVGTVKHLGPMGEGPARLD